MFKQLKEDINTLNRRMGKGEERNETDEKYMIQNEEEKKNPLDVVSSRSAPTNKKSSECETL